MGRYVGHISKSCLFREYILKEGERMIFVTLGSQKFQFDRLLKYIDNLMDKKVISEAVFAQTGYSSYKPKNFYFENFLTREDFAKKIDLARVVITHAGTGAIITSLKSGKKVIAMPRLQKYGEHVDDHQQEIVSNFATRNFIINVQDEKELEEALQKIDYFDFEQFYSNNKLYLEYLKDYLLK